MENKNQRTRKNQKANKKPPPEKVFRSMKEIRKHFFPNFYEEEERRNRTPETVAIGAAADILEKIRRRLRE